MGRKYKITIDVEYDDDGADPSWLLDSFQDNASELLSPGEDMVSVKDFEVCVEDMD